MLLMGAAFAELRAFRRTAEDFKALRKEMEELKAGPIEIQKTLQSLKELLAGKQASPSEVYIQHRWRCVRG